MQSDKEKYLEFWGYALGTSEADEAWRLKCEHTSRRAPAVFGDLPGYDSPVTGKWVEGRAARREDLRRTGCVPYDPEMKKDAARTRAELECKADAKLEQAAARAYYAMPESKRRLLSRG